jgi:hypothetical protein
VTPLGAKQLGIGASVAVLMASLAVSGWVLVGGATSSTVGQPQAIATGEAGNVPSAGPTLTPIVVVTHPRQSSASFQAGATVVIYGNDPYFQAKSASILDHLATVGVNSVAVMIPIFQNSWRASTVYADSQLTPTPQNLAIFFQEANLRGFSVLVRPILDESKLGFVSPGIPHWRGDIVPVNLNAWFSSYDNLLVQYAQAAQTGGADIFDVGTEMNSLQEDRTAWLQTIGLVRQVFSGEITYSANYNYLIVPFAQALDFVSVDAFYPLAVPAGASTQTLINAWRSWVPDLTEFRRSTGKPVVITEAGVTSEIGSYQSPAVWHHYVGLSLQDQAAYYDATCAAVKPVVQGIYWWEYDFTPPTSPHTNTGFDPQGKPAEAALTRCFSP